MGLDGPPTATHGKLPRIPKKVKRASQLRPAVAAFGLSAAAQNAAMGRLLVREEKKFYRLRFQNYLVDALLRGPEAKKGARILVNMAKMSEATAAASARPEIKRRSLALCVLLSSGC